MITGIRDIFEAIRLENGEYLKDMAEKLGVSPRYLISVESEWRRMPPEWADKLGVLYNLDISTVKNIRDTAARFSRKGRSSSLEKEQEK